MFWTIVGALLFVFVGIPILLLIVQLLAVAGLVILQSLGVDDLIDAFLLRPKEIIWRIISSLIGGVLAIIFLVNSYGQEKDTGWETIGVGFLGLYFLFVGVMGSFSPKRWK